MRLNPSALQIRNVLVVDGHPVVRRGVRALIESRAGFRVSGEASNGFDAVKVAMALKPDIVVLALSMPDLDGVETMTELQQYLPGIEFVIFTKHRNVQLLAKAITAGARACVCKSESDELLLHALRAVARGEAYFSPTISEVLGYQQCNRDGDDEPLTSREKQVVSLVAEGCSNAEIARRLNISISTTSTHREAAMRKTGANSVVGLTQYAVRHGLVEL